jgi:hypothetical protein
MQYGQITMHSESFKGILFVFKLNEINLRGNFKGDIRWPRNGSTSISWWVLEGSLLVTESPVRSGVLASGPPNRLDFTP